MHIFPLLSSIIDLSINRIEIELNHFVLPLVYSFAYSTTLYIYTVVSGELVYEVTNFRTVTSWLIVIATIASSAGTHFVFYYSAKCRKPPQVAAKSYNSALEVNLRK